MAQCPNDQFLFELASGVLDPEGLTRADSHLDECGDCREVVAALALASGGDGALPRGAQVGRYLIVDVLGRGAMGTVYAAFDPELDRAVALKILRAEIAMGRSELLIKEATTMARLSHPNVVPIYDVGRAHETVYFAMELVRGRSIREWLADEKPGWREIRDVFSAACKGIVAAHENGIVHRDVKPDNILIANDGSVKVTDFGVASVIEQAIPAGPGSERPDAINLERTGTLSGTPAYMAPEQLRGDRATTRTDQFSFCVALYEALAARRPFAGETIDQLEESIENAPSSLPLLAAPRWLATAVRRGLAGDESERYSSMNELGRALETDRRRAPRIRATAATIAIAIAITGTWWAGGGRTKPVLSPCDHGEKRAASIWNKAREVRLAEALGKSATPQLRESLDRTIAQLNTYATRWAANYRTVCRASHIDGLQSPALLDARMHCLDSRLREASALSEKLVDDERSRRFAFAQAIADLRSSDRCVQLSSANLGDPPTEAQARALPPIEQQLAEVRAARALGDWTTARNSARIAFQQAEAIGYSPIVAEAALLLARSLASDDQLIEADRVAKRALAQAFGSGANELVAEVLLAHASILGERGELDRAIETAELASAAISRLDDPPALAAELGIVRSLILAARGESAAAEQALRSIEKLVSPSNYARANAMQGELAANRGDLDGAERAHREALRANRELLGKSHPAVAANLHNIAGLLRKQGQLAEAKSLYDESLALSRSTHGDGHSSVALTRNSLGLLLVAQARPERAIIEFEISHGILARTGHPELGAVAQNLVDARRQLRAKGSAVKTPKPSGGAYAPAKPWQPGR